LTYVALVVALVMWRRTPRPKESAPLRPLILLVGLCVMQFFFWQVIWLIAYARGIV
jgi:hypothetical protein